MSTPVKWMDAAAQAENVRLREALAKARGELFEDGDSLPGTTRALDTIEAAIATPPGSRAALREMLTKMGEQIAWECGGVQKNVAKRVAVNASRLLSEEGGQS